MYQDKKVSVKVRERENIRSGTISLRIDIYNEGHREVITLPYKLAPETSKKAKAENKRLRDKAEKRAAELLADINRGLYTPSSKIAKKTIVTAWMQMYVDSYTKKDKRNMQGVLNRFKDFLALNKNSELVFGKLNESLIEDFQDYLRNRCKGEGSASYFARFKKMMKRAYKTDLKGNTNPAEDVKVKRSAPRKKDVLTMDEIKAIAATNTESPQVKKAFLFSCITGLRWVDIKGLKWSHINISSRLLTKEQSKIEGASKSVTIPLNETALKLIGKPGNPSDFVFDLPSANGANKTIKALVKRAGIQKEIRWHNARHSFGTNLIYMGEDVTTASALLGHSTLKHTQRYVKTAEELKRRATDAINFDL